MDKLTGPSGHGDVAAQNPATMIESMVEEPSGSPRGEKRWIENAPSRRWLPRLDLAEMWASRELVLIGRAAPAPLHQPRRLVRVLPLPLFDRPPTLDKSRRDALAKHLERLAFPSGVRWLSVPRSVKGISLRPVCWPETLQAVSPWRAR